jgi:hypothetical protein
MSTCWWTGYDAELRDRGFNVGTITPFDRKGFNFHETYPSDETKLPSQNDGLNHVLEVSK